MCLRFLVPENVTKCEMCGDWFYNEEIVVKDGIKMCIYCAESEEGDET